MLTACALSLTIGFVPSLPSTASAADGVYRDARETLTEPACAFLSSDWQRHSDVRAQRGAARERIVVRFHVVRRSDGTGGIDESVIDDIVRDLNWGFRDTDFAFVREPGTWYLDSDAWYADLPGTFDQVPPINAAYQEGVLSWVLVPSLFGGTIDAGTWVGEPFTTSERGVIHAYYSAGQPRRTVTPIHEMGHIFGLAHPYEVVFGVGCTSGANCGTTGDRICDTPASPTVFGANTKATGEFFAEIPGPCPRDPNYAPNTRLFMEAGWEAGHMLRDRFTPGQFDRMITWRHGVHADLIGPLRPDVLVDCDGDGLDDIDQIESGLVRDVNRDLIPDSCQVFARPNDLIVFDMATSGVQRPRIFDPATGAHRGDIWSGLSWSHTGRVGPGGLIYVPRLTFVYALDPRTGRPAGAVLDGVLEGTSVLVDVLFDSHGRCLVLENSDSKIRRYLADGTFDGEFADLGARAITGAKFMEWGPDGHIYVVNSGGKGDRVHRVDGTTGAYLGRFTDAGAGGMGAGQGLTFHQGSLFVSDGATNSVHRFDAATGDHLEVFVASQSGGLASPHKLAFGPDGHLYVASRGDHSIKRYDGTTGDYIDDAVGPGHAGVTSPAGFVFAPRCPADLDGDDGADTDDINAFVALFLAGDLTTDLDGNGVLNLDDIDAFVAAFLTGC